MYYDLDNGYSRKMGNDEKKESALVQLESVKDGDPVISVQYMERDCAGRERGLY